MLTLEEAFTECLEKCIKKNCTKGVWASYKHRHIKGKISPKTIKKLLEKFGYICVQQEQWTSSTITFTIAKFDRENLKFSITEIEADSAREAIRINYGGVDVTNDIEAFNKFVNRCLDEIKGF